MKVVIVGNQLIDSLKHTPLPVIGLVPLLDTERLKLDDGWDD